MKKMNLLLAGVLCMAIAASAGADFSGTWVLDPENSDQMRMGPGGGGAPTEITMTITMSPTEMTVSRTTARGASETKYVLDGKENTASTQRGELKYKAVWEGNSLTISGTRTTQRGERPMKEVYSISADGKVLTIVSTRTGQQGETTRKQVFNKK
jgi:DNA-binding CsgD family transcriptional regulator